MQTKVLLGRKSLEENYYREEVRVGNIRRVETLPAENKLRLTYHLSNAKKNVFPKSGRPKLGEKTTGWVSGGKAKGNRKITQNGWSRCG